VREVGVGKVGQDVEWYAILGDRIHHRSERVEGARGDTEGADHRAGVGAPAVVERFARANGVRKSVVLPRPPRTTITIAASGSSKFVR
jgi:hypothetical protein